MRILFWQEAFWPHVGGLQAQAEWLLPTLRERGHDIAIVTRRDTADRPEIDHWNEFPLHRFPFWQVLDRGDPRAIHALQEEVESLCGDCNADVVHVNGFGPTAFFALHALRERRTPLLVALHSSNTLTGTRTSVLEHLLGRAQWVSACSASLLDSARRCVPSITERSSVVVNGVRQPGSVQPLPHDPPRVVCIGHLVHHKGYDLMIAAAQRLTLRLPTFRLVIAGDGPERPALERQARESGIAAAVEFPGIVARAAVVDLINSATVIVVPSRRESFGIVAVEAALLQRPVVATRVGGLPEIIAHDETGLLVEPDDPIALADAIAALLENPERAERMGAAGRARAAREFALERQCDAYEALYRKIGGIKSADDADDRR